MLFKDLKSIMEVEEPELDDEGNPIVEPKPEVPRKTDKQKEIGKTTADGVGNETYDVTSKLSSDFETVLKQYLPTVTSVKSSKGALFIEGTFTNDEDTMGLVQMAISAELDTVGLDKFDINPKILPTKIIVTFVSKV